MFESSCGPTFERKSFFHAEFFCFSIQQAFHVEFFSFNREQALGNYIQAPYNKVEFADGIPIHHVSLELHLLSPLQKEP